MLDYNKIKMIKNQPFVAKSRINLPGNPLKNRNNEIITGLSCMIITEDKK